jgi:hypothetical protein
MKSFAGKFLKEIGTLAGGRDRCGGRVCRVVKEKFGIRLYQVHKMECVWPDAPSGDCSGTDQGRPYYRKNQTEPVSQAGLLPQCEGRGGRRCAGWRRRGKGGGIRFGPNCRDWGKRIYSGWRTKAEEDRRDS